MMDRRAFIILLGGAGVARSLKARAQQPLPLIGFLHQGSQDPPPLTTAFSRGLSEAGITEGRDVTIEHRYANGHYDRLPALAAELIRHRPAVIAAALLPASLAAKAATTTIPVVFVTGSDPIAAGLVPRLNRLTGNVTGIAFMFTLLQGKSLQLLHELLPKATAVGALANPNNPNAPPLRDLQAAAQTLARIIHERTRRRADGASGRAVAM
jgi:putative ABC transport system substrate-binding protein